MSPDGLPEASRRLAAILHLAIGAHRERDRAVEDQRERWEEEARTILQAEAGRQGGRVARSDRGQMVGVFPTARSATECAMTIQEAIQTRNREVSAPYRIVARIGLHLGDLAEEAGQVSGDAVEMAGYAAPLAEAGGVALTGVVYSQIKGQTAIRALKVGTYRFAPGIPRMPVFIVSPPGRSFLLWRLGRMRTRIVAVAVLLAVAAGGAFVAIRMTKTEVAFPGFEDSALRWTYAGGGATVDVAVADDETGRIVSMTYAGSADVTGYWGVGASSRSMLGGDWSSFAGLKLEMRSASGRPVKLCLYEKGVKSPGQDGEIWQCQVSPAVDWREIRIPFTLFSKRGTYQPVEQDNNDVLNTDRIGGVHIDHVGTDSDVLCLRRVRLTRETKNLPPGKPLAPKGPEIARRLAETAYSASSLDPDGDLVRYTFRWDDGTVSETDWAFSGAPVRTIHTWTTTGTHAMAVMATDAQGLASEWSTPHATEVKMSEALFEDFESLDDVWTWGHSGATVTTSTTTGIAGAAVKARFVHGGKNHADFGVFKEAKNLNDGNWSEFPGIRFDYKSTSTKPLFLVVAEADDKEAGKQGMAWILQLAPSREWKRVDAPFTSFRRWREDQPFDPAADRERFRRMQILTFHASPGTRGIFCVDDIYLTISPTGAPPAAE